MSASQYSCNTVPFLIQALPHKSIKMAHSNFTTISFSSLQPVLCHNDERLALMQFKESFIIDKSAPAATSSAYPKVEKWKFQGVDCCSWDGIECDKISGQVIGLNLSNSFLYGSINSSSSLFHLVHLQTLNLAYNDFNYSVIPSALGNLSMLTYLNLSHSVFSGQIPSKISELHKLSFLDLESNEGLLELKTPDLKSLIRNLTNLKYLHLSGVDVASRIPSVLANFSSLTSLRLERCGLLGKFPLAIFHQPSLEKIWMIHNLGLTGYFPEFNFTSKLKVMAFFNTNFSGEIPASIGNLDSLEFLGIGRCYFRGFVPSTLGNLSKLQVLDIGYNFFRGLVPSSLGNLTKLYYMDLQNNNFTGVQREYPKIIRSLVAIDMSSNRFDGEIPESIGNLKELHSLNFSNNNLDGRIPLAISKLINLEGLDLSQNKLAGRIPWELSTQLTFLAVFNVSHNHLTGPIPQGPQFDTFQTSSFDGNLGLCGKPLLKECDSSIPSPHPFSANSEDSGLLDWKIVCLGYVSGLLIGGAIGHFVTTRKRDWFTKLFSKSHGRRQRR
ncbi:hypothetical protein DITRI_Ditri20bG0094800 [Diplodiscus trichospermus]